MAWLIYSLIREALPVRLSKMTFSPTPCFISLYGTHHPSDTISGHPRKRLWWLGITDIFTITGLPLCLGVLDHTKKEISVPWLTVGFQANTIALSWHSSWSVNTHKVIFPKTTPQGQGGQVTEGYRLQPQMSWGVTPPPRPIHLGVGSKGNPFLSSEPQDLAHFLSNDVTFLGGER